MPEQTNSISSGLSPLVKTPRAGRADPAASMQTSSSKGSMFSNDLNQARQRQMDAASTEPAHRSRRAEDRPVSAAGTESTSPPANDARTGRADGRSLRQDSLVDDSASLEAAGNSGPVDRENAAVALLTETSETTRESTDQLSSLMVGQVAGQLMSESTAQAAGQTVGKSPVESTDQTLTGAAQSNNVVILEGPATADVSGKKPEAVLPFEQRSTVATTAVSQAASPVRAAIGAPGDSDEVAVLQATPAGQPRELPSGPAAEQSRERSSGPAAGTLVEAARATVHEAVNVNGSTPASATDNGSTAVAANVSGSTTTTATVISTSSATSSTSINSATAESRVGSVETGLDAGEELSTNEPLSDSAVQKRSMENPPLTTNAAALAKARSVETVQGTVLTGSETLMSSGQTDKASIPQVNAVELTQLASGNGIVTQATLAGRFRHLNGDMAARGADTSKTAAVQAGLPGPGVRLPEHQSVVEELPTTLAEDGLSDMNSLMAATEKKVTVQQRIATAEAMLSQMAQEGSDVAGKVRAADNLLLAAAGSTLSTPLAQSSESVTGPIAQAPMNINLTSTDAETALAGNVKWMTNEGLKNAVMTVTPHGMGPISVKIGIDGDQMDVSIIASQHSTRDALESMLPRLREQLSVQGHDSVKVDVSDGKGEQTRSGNGQSFAEQRNPTGAMTQDSQSNSSNHGERPENGRSEALEVVSESFMAEDLQRVAARAIGEAGNRPVFDAYV